MPAHFIALACYKPSTYTHDLLADLLTLCLTAKWAGQRHAELDQALLKEQHPKECNMCPGKLQLKKACK